MASEVGHRCDGGYMDFWAGEPVWIHGPYCQLVENAKKPPKRKALKRGIV